MMFAYSLYVWYEFARAECWSFAIASGVHMWSSPRTRVRVFAAGVEHRREQRVLAVKHHDAGAPLPSATSNRPMPPTFDAVPGKYW